MIQAHKPDLWMVVVVVVSVVVIHIQARSNEDGHGTIFLERGNPGILSCPPFASGRIPLDQIDAMYWYFPPERPENVLISYFLGNVAPQNGIPEGVYDINKNFSLVIENVTDSDEGTYRCRVKPRLKMIIDGYETMRVKAMVFLLKCCVVSPKDPFPDVTQCTERISETACEAELPKDIKKPMLTCIVRDTKPAVALRWLLENSDGDTQLISDRFIVQTSEYLVNTFTTSASILIITSNADTMYRCQAYGEALGARNGSHVTVTVTTTHGTSQKPLITSVQPPTAAALIPKLGFKSAVEDAPDSFQNAVIGLAVALCLSLAVIVGLVIAACKRMPEQKNDIEENNNQKRYRENKGSQGETQETCLDCEVVIPLNGVNGQCVACFTS